LFLPTRAKANSGDRRRTRKNREEEENGKQCEDSSGYAFDFFERTTDVAAVATMALVAVAAITGTCSISDDSVSVAATSAAMTETTPAATISASPAGLEVAAMAWTSAAVVVMVLGHRAPRPDHPCRW
jgi:hypothetical protein